MVESYVRSFLVPKAIALLKGLNEAPCAAGLRNSFGMIQRLVLARG